MGEVTREISICNFSKPNFLLDINTLEKNAATTLSLNEIGECILELDQDIAFEPYNINKQLGSFIVIDRVTNNTVAMGLIESSTDTKGWVDRYIEQRDQYWVRSLVSNDDRASKAGHQPLFILFTGAVDKSVYSEFETQTEKLLFESNYQVSIWISGDENS